MDRKLLSCFKLGASSIALIIGSAYGNAALAQASANAAPAVESVTVTGTSIRGVAPVGSNLITVDQNQMRVTGAVNAEQLLNNVTAISTAGGPPQGVNVNSGYQPQIHQLAGSVSNSTLAVVNGMRFVGDGTDFLADPNIIPSAALERVEVLADGASATYGSDAVSGVVNYITRKSFEGLEINAQTGFASDYTNATGNLLWGTSWDSGSVMVAASYLFQSNLHGSDRDLLKMGDYTPIGGNNFIQKFGCPTASMIVPGNSGVYLSPSSMTTVSNDQSNASCNLQPYGDALPESIRQNVLMQVRQDFSSKISASVMMIYNELDVRYKNRPGVISGNSSVFGPGSGKGGQINPFYQAPAGAPTATSEKINWVDLLGLGPNGTDFGHEIDNKEVFYMQAGLTYNITDDWHAQLTDALGVNRSDSGSLNAFCNSCALLALNGTGSTSGSMTASNVAGKNIISLNLPLTTTNALDVWNGPGGSNLTSEAVRKDIYSSTLISDNENTMNQTRLVVNGPLFELPAGPAKIAVGAEYVNFHELNYGNGQLGVGNPALGATASVFRSRRHVYSFLGEINAPIISPDMNIPLAQSVTADISARYDNYNDAGPTFNPKYAIDWQINDSFKLRANYSTSFVAAPLGVVGDPSKGGEYGSGTGIARAVNVPIAAFPTVVQLPGCNTAQVLAQGFCQIGGSSAAQGLTRQYGTALTGAKPQTGNGINIGLDFTPTFIPGLVLNVTYFNQKYKGGITAPNDTQITTIPAFHHLMTLCPAGCTQEQIDAFTRVPQGGTVNGTMPSTVYFTSNHDENNVLSLAIQGIDLTGRYDYMTDYGDFHIGEGLTEFFVFDQNIVGAPSFSELGTSGINSTFPSVAYHSRTNLGWSNDTIAADLFVNWTAPYKNAGNTAVNPIILDANGNYAGGGDHVNANVTLDAHVSYDFPGGVFSGDQLYLDVQNLLDQAPPFYNGTSKPSEVHSQAGENIFISNPIGRLISVGFRVKM